MSGTVTGLNIDAVEAQRAAWAEAVVRGDDGCANDYAYRLAAAVPSLLAAARGRDRALALLDEWEAKAGPESSAWDVFGPQKVSVPFALEQIRAALGTEQEGHTE